MYRSVQGSIHNLALCMGELINGDSNITTIVSSAFTGQIQEWNTKQLPTQPVIEA